MNRFVNAAIVGGAALAVGIIPVASTAYAATAPTPPPVTVVAPPIAPGPGHHTTPVPGSPKANPGSHHTGGAHGTSGRGHGAPGRGTTGRGTPGRGSSGSGSSGSGSSGRRTPGHRTPAHHTPTHRAPAHHTTTHRTPSHRSPRPVPTPVRTAKLSLDNQPGIIDGADATNAPWAAQVSWAGMGYECSGSVVAPEWILTAGHCASRDGISVQVGSLQLGGGDKITVDRAEVDTKADLALLHLSKPTKAPAVKLATDDPKAGAINQIFGWGMTAPGSGPAQQLKVAKVKVTGADCEDAAQGPAICVTGMTGAAFNGDSGGPEMAAGDEVGVCSTGDENAKTAQYASIAANRPWIKQVAGV
ncbi:MAG TPA: trypsin-like serine protease [Actinocrinis sp.]|uniref:S1 family peptidase n=1 Tax=Actinocrinis sp. TaxID=1920516 RepID=UPI002DDD136D|nr:trypsin-like serine protease [Actinocrinis sp.]HEV3169832.1 trypsin-like serine protease [Actinocrinis sp.]